MEFKFRSSTFVYHLFQLIMETALIEKILEKRDLIVDRLYSWAETFDWEIDEEGERTFVPYDIVYSLAERLEQGNCNEKDYEEILFHIWQINHGEDKIAF